MGWAWWASGYVGRGRFKVMRSGADAGRLKWVLKKIDVEWGGLLVYVILCGVQI